VCTNHFQGKSMVNSAQNIEQLRESASAYRYQRLEQLLGRNGPNTVQKTVNILRDQKGLNDADIGMGNEKALNQLIAHHSIVFEPDKLLVWVSTAPWQLGEYVAYDLKKVFGLRGMKTNQEVAETNLNIAADSFLLTPKFRQFEAFRVFKQRIADGGDVNTDSLLATNPQFYNSYILAGDYQYKKGRWSKAAGIYQLGLTKEIATLKEKAHIQERIRLCNKKQSTQ
ncbi:MAG: peptidase C45, partial [Chitinophagaceae bacterium]